MAFQPKLDRCNIIAMTTPSGTGAQPIFLIRDAKRGGSEPAEVYQPDLQEGETDFDPYGEDATPSNTYAVKGGTHSVAAGAVKLAAVVAVTEKEGSGSDPDIVKNYALAEYSLDSKNKSPLAISGSSQLVEDGVDASRQAYWPLPAHVVSSRQIPQDFFGCFTLSGTGCSLQSVKATAKVMVSTDKLVGKIISSDSNTGILTVTGTILRNKKIANNSEPTITPLATEVVLEGQLKSKWTLTKSPTPTEDNPETAYPTYEFELSLPLKKVIPTPES